MIQKEYLIIWVLNEVFENFEILSIVGTTFLPLGFGLYLALKSLEKDMN